MASNLVRAGQLFGIAIGILLIAIGFMGILLSLGMAIDHSLTTLQALGCGVGSLIALFIGCLLIASIFNHGRTK
jgi:hypothetical protein